MDIGAWLRGLGLERYEQAFRDNEIDQRILPELTADDLKAQQQASENQSCSAGNGVRFQKVELVG